MNHKAKRKQIAADQGRSVGEGISGLTWGIWICAVWAVFVFAAYINRNPFLPILERADAWFPTGFPTLSIVFSDLASFLVTLVLILGALSIGWIGMRLFSFLSPLGTLVISTVLGLGAVAYFILLLGYLQLFNTPVFVGLFIGFISLFIFSFKRGLSLCLKNSWTQYREIMKSSSFLLSALLYFILVFGFLMAFVPEIFYDSLVYHLGAPRWYLLSGGIKKFTNLHFNYPLTIQMLYIPTLSLGGEPSAKLVHWFCAVLLALGFLAFGYEQKAPRVGVWAAVAFLSMPMAQLNFWTTGVDVAITLFAVSAAWVWIGFISQESEVPPDKHILMVCAVLTGFCYGSKLTAGLVLGVLGGVHILFLLIRKAGMKRILTDGLFFGLVAFAVILPWMIRSYFYTGNPIFPFLSRFFNGLDADRMSRFYGESRGVTPTQIWKWICLLWFLTFEGLSGLSYMGPMLLAFFPLSIWVLFFKKEVPLPIRLLFLVGFLGCFILAFVNRLTRYWMPYFGILILAMSWGIDSSRKSSKWVGGLLTIVAFAIGFVNTVHALGIGFNNYQPWPVLLGTESRTEFQSYTHPGMNPMPSTKLYDWAEKNLPAGSKILIYGDEKIGNCKIPFLASGVYDVPLLEQWAAPLQNAEELKKKFEQEGISHILVNLMEGKRLLGYGVGDFSEKSIRIIDEFWNRYVDFAHMEEVPERYEGKKPPLLLYQVRSLPKEPGTQPLWDPILALYQDAHPNNKEEHN